MLGGTGFIGPHIVRRALERGHEFTLFNRGRSNTEFFPEVDGREMPTWTDIFDGVTQLMTENQSSIDVGLKFRPFVETVTDTLAWHRQMPQNKQAFTRAGIDARKETEVLAAWRQHQLAVSASS